MAHRVLVADDSSIVQRVVRQAFEQSDVEIITAENGAEAIEVLERDAPDLVLADTRMPGATGYEVAEVVNRRPAERRIPVVLLTGSFEAIDERRARAAGCDTVLVKPFEPEQLVSVVSGLLGIPPRAKVPPPPIAPRADVEADIWDDVDDRELRWLVTEEPDVDDPSRPGRAASVPRGGTVDEALVERVATRVIERLSDAVVRDTTARIVGEVAERLVRRELGERLSDPGLRELVVGVVERLVGEELGRLKEKRR